MDVTELFEQAPGEWEGTYRLWMRPADVPDAESATRATVAHELGGHALALRYDWRNGETHHHGIAIISRAEGGGVEMGWSDTFHASSGVMHNAAIGAEPKVLAHYGPADEPWGWRTEFDMPSRDELVIRAFNILPSGEEALATEATYRRAD
jgi:hypothetical protein